MDKTAISATDFFLPGSENARLDHLHKLISVYLSSKNPKTDGAGIPRAHNPHTTRANAQ